MASSTVIDLRTIDMSKVDPETVNLGTDAQDCALIARTYERAAHSTPTEAAVFATFNRQLGNMQLFSNSAITSLSSYIQSPKDAAATANTQASDLATSAGVSPNSTTGGTTTSTSFDSLLQSFNAGKTSSSTLGSSFGNTLLDWAKDCIPCSLRLTAFLELNPTTDLLGVLEDDLENKLASLMSIIDMLQNLLEYDNFCDLLNMLSFMCIPDLQRLIATLMALLLLDVPDLDGLIDLLAQMIAPIFAPIFMSMTTLLDQFVLLVTSPLECVVDAFEQQINKLNMEINFKGETVAITSTTQTGTQEVQDELDDMYSQMNSMSSGLKSSLQELTDLVDEAIQKLKNRLAFYIEEIKAMLGEFGLGDATYLRLSMRKLTIIRMISFIVAVITAMAQGHDACSGDGKTPSTDAIDNFFNTFLNPQSAFNMWVDDKGLIHVDEKVASLDVSILSSDGNVFEFEGEDLLSPTITQTTQQISQALTVPTTKTLPCRLDTPVAEANKVNRWMAELDKSS